MARWIVQKITEEGPVLEGTYEGPDGEVIGVSVLGLNTHRIVPIRKIGSKPQKEKSTKSALRPEIQKQRTRKKAARELFEIGIQAIYSTCVMQKELKKEIEASIKRLGLE